MRKRVLHLGFEISHAGAVAAEVREFATIWTAAAWAMNGERRYYARIERDETRGARHSDAAEAPQQVELCGEGHCGGRKASGRRDA